MAVSGEERKQLRELVTRWREAIPRLLEGAKGSPSYDLQRLLKERAEAFTICTNELDSVLLSTEQKPLDRQTE
jgi:hypothetical protein